MPIKKIDKKELYHTVVNLVFEHGYDACSLSMIAKACGVVKATVLYHGGSKDQVIFNAIKCFNTYDDQMEDFKIFMVCMKIMLCSSNCSQELFSYCIKKYNEDMWIGYRLGNVIERYFEVLNQE